MPWLNIFINTIVFQLIVSEPNDICFYHLVQTTQKKRNCMYNESKNVRALASRDAKKKKKNHFAFSNTTLSILSIHFTTHHTSQFLFLYTTQ